MSNVSDLVAFVGVDVSAKELTVAVQRGTEDIEVFAVTNTPDGHKELLKRALGGRQGAARFVLEATGLYSLDVALFLEAHPRAEVMVANPRAAKAFARARMRRAKTDTVDARLLLEFAQNMPFQSWKAPSQGALTLRTYARRLRNLANDRAREKNRLHALSASNAMPQAIRDDIEDNLAHLELRIDKLEAQAISFLKSQPDLKDRAELLITLPGIAWRSAIYILGELACLDADMDARQLVAHAGLDPRPFQSGTSVHANARISKAGNKYLRAALYMPAITASRCAPEVKAFYERLAQKGKRGLQPAIAVMRKLLHAIHGVLRSATPYDPSRFSPHAVAAM